jgi:hypothetical protein
MLHSFGSCCLLWSPASPAWLVFISGTNYSKNPGKDRARHINQHSQNTAGMQNTRNGMTVLAGLLPTPLSTSALCSLGTGRAGPAFL